MAFVNFLSFYTVQELNCSLVAFHHRNLPSRSCNSSENAQRMIVPKSEKDPLIKDFFLVLVPLFTYFQGKV